MYIFTTLALIHDVPIYQLVYTYLLYYYALCFCQEDLAIALESECQLLDAASGGVCFDEASMNPWASFQDLAAALPHCPPVPMACQACTVELRGQNDVCVVCIYRHALACISTLTTVVLPVTYYQLPTYCVCMHYRYMTTSLSKMPMRCCDF